MGDVERESVYNSVEIRDDSALSRLRMLGSRAVSAAKDIVADGLERLVTHAGATSHIIERDQQAGMDQEGQ